MIDLDLVQKVYNSIRRSSRFTLMVLNVSGAGYVPVKEVPKLEELDDDIIELDRSLTPWYIEKDGAPIAHRVSKTHEKLLGDQ